MLTDINKILLVEIMTGNFGDVLNYNTSFMFYPELYSDTISDSNKMINFLGSDRSNKRIRNTKLSVKLPVLYTSTNYENGKDDINFLKDKQGIEDIKYDIGNSNIHTLIINLHPGPARKINNKFNDLVEIPDDSIWLAVLPTTVESFLLSAFWFKNCYHAPAANEPLNDNYTGFINRITDYYLDHVGKSILNYRKEHDITIFDINDIIYHGSLKSIPILLSDILNKPLTDLALIEKFNKSFNSAKFINDAIDFVKESKLNGLYDRVEQELKSKTDFLNTISDCNIIRGQHGRL